MRQTKPDVTGSDQLEHRSLTRHGLFALLRRAFARPLALDAIRLPASNHAVQAASGAEWSERQPLGSSRCRLCASVLCGANRTARMLHKGRVLKMSVNVTISFFGVLLSGLIVSDERKTV